MDQHIHSDGQTLSLSHLAKKLSHVSANLCYDQNHFIKTIVSNLADFDFSR